MKNGKNFGKRRNGDTIIFTFRHRSNSTHGFIESKLLMILIVGEGEWLGN